jgi:hypothetical protein
VERVVDGGGWWGAVLVVLVVLGGIIAGWGAMSRPIIALTRTVAGVCTAQERNINIAGREKRARLSQLKDAPN